MCNVCRVRCEYQEEIWDDLSEGYMELVEVWDDCGLNSALGSSVQHVSIELDLALKKTWAEQFSIDIPGSTLGYWLNLTTIKDNAGQFISGSHTFVFGDIVYNSTGFKNRIMDFFGKHNWFLYKWLISGEQVMCICNCGGCRKGRRRDKLINELWKAVLDPLRKLGPNDFSPTFSN